MKFKKLTALLLTAALGMGVLTACSGDETSSDGENLTYVSLRINPEIELIADEREEAKEHGISPGKYKVISEIIGANPEYTVEDLKDKSMAELKDLLPKADKNPNKNNKK